MFPSSLVIALLNVEKYKKSPKLAPAPWESDLLVFPMGKRPPLKDKPSSKTCKGIACTLRQVRFRDLFMSLQSEANTQNRDGPHVSHQRPFLKGPSELTGSCCQVEEESGEEWRGDELQEDQHFLGRDLACCDSSYLGPSFHLLTR